jgi:UDP-N-acetylmuramyl pentapeptide phosphotransferase/UDP-N-acetylglucosamine-1-phosphate transferase
MFCEAIKELVWVGLGMISSLILIIFVWKKARRWGLIDRPNERSSHIHETPKGGGVGIVLPVLIVLLIGPWLGLPQIFSWIAACALAIIALTGFLDDLYLLCVGHRLLVHLGVGLAVGGLASHLALPYWHVMGTVKAVFLVWWAFWTVSAINVINFMDGIDGLIGIQAFIYAGFALLAFQSRPEFAIIALVLFGSSLGFLALNWPPARIFMGGIGSESLGVIFVLIGILSIQTKHWSFVHAYLPLAPLFIDEVLTMGRRIAQKERLWVAHRSHVYQMLVKSGWSHGHVALLYGSLTLMHATWSLAMSEPSLAFWLGALLLTFGTILGLVLLRLFAERTFSGFPQQLSR